MLFSSVFLTSSDALAGVVVTREELKEAINDQGSEVGMPGTSDDHLTDAFREGTAAAVEFY